MLADAGDGSGPAIAVSGDGGQSTRDALRKRRSAAENPQQLEADEGELPVALTGVGEVREPRDEDTAMIDVVIDHRYRITGVLGRGAMGSVYRAEHVTIRREVALKVLHEGLEGLPEMSARFEREAFAVGRINHPNCMTVFDYGKLEQGVPYLALELVHGRTLAEVLEHEGRLEPQRALVITRHVLRGLAQCHRQGVVHRDVKPDNIILTVCDGDADFAKLVDFGIARLEGEAEAIQGGERLTHTGIVCGTPQYMSPEQVVGKAIDVRADLYATAAVLFEMISGRPPFDDQDRLAVATMHVSSPPPSLAEVAPDVDAPLGLETLLRRALAKERGDRFASAAAMIEAIDECLEGAPAIPAGDASGPAARPKRRAKRLDSSRDTRRVRIQAAAIQEGGLRQRVAGLVSRHQRVARWGLPLIAAFAMLAAGAWRFAVSDPGPSSAAVAAAERLERGDPAGALAVLDRVGSGLDDDAHGQLQRGHAHASRHEPALALDAYERAIALRSQLRHDPVLQTNLDLFLDATEPDVLLGAAELLIRELDEPAAADRVVELASSATDAALRHGALALAEEFDLDGRVDLVRSFSLDLTRGETCEARRQAVSKLRALGDHEAMPALRKALRRDPSDNACLREKAKAALRYLDSIRQRRQQAAGPAAD